MYTLLNVIPLECSVRYIVFMVCFGLGPPSGVLCVSTICLCWLSLHRILPLDLCDAAVCLSAPEKAVELFGRVDILINNAGIAIHVQ